MTEIVSESKEDKQTKILAVASQLFDRFGPKKATIDDIARAAGLGKGTIYLYFKSKDEIFLSVVRAELKTLLEQIRVALTAGGTTEDRLRRYMSVRFGHLEAMLARYHHRMEIVQESHEQPGMLQLRNDYIRSEAELVRELIESGISRGELSCADPALASTAIAMMMFACCLDWMHHGRSLQPEDKVEVMTKLILHGLLHR